MGSIPGGAVETPGVAGASPRFFKITQIVEPASSAGAKRGSAHDLPLATRPLRENVEVFSERGYGLFPSVDPALDLKWRVVLANWRRDEKVAQRCIADLSQCSDTRGRTFAQLVTQARGKPELEKLRTVNAQVNATVSYKTDLRNYGVPDYWASPFETLAGYGDCEDYAVLKFFVLLQAGVPADTLSLILLRDEAVGEDHAVLAVHTAQGWRLLDNRWDRLDDPRTARSYVPRYRVTLSHIEMFAEPFNRISLRPSLQGDATPGSGPAR